MKARAANIDICKKIRRKRVFKSTKEKWKAQVARLCLNFFQLSLSSNFSLSGVIANAALLLTETNRISPVMQMHVLLATKNKESTSTAVIDDPEVPITQEPEISQVREETWTLVGLTFVDEGTEYSVITGEVKDKEGSWYMRYVPVKGMEKWVLRITTVYVMEEGILQMRRQGRVVHMT